jgi:CheY-like chemotaxis protein
MTKQETITADVAAHTCIAQALAAAQSQMGNALKDSKNPHFKSSYADLSSVRDACMPALNAHGIAVIQPIRNDPDLGRCVTTIFLHPSGETLDCPVPIITGKNDMQGLGSAITYARRYGLMSLAGIAPDDDDGNAASKNQSNKKEVPNADDMSWITAIKGDSKVVEQITDPVYKTRIQLFIKEGY